MPSTIDTRLHAMKAVDVVLAALQAAFAEERLIDGANPYRFIATDPKNSKLWICDPQGRTGFDRSGNRLLIVVYRTDFQPRGLHLLNHAEGSSDQKMYSDLCATNVYIQCEAGNATQSEALASIAFQVIKMFRIEMMREFDLYEINPNNVSAPQQMTSIKGEPWVTTVSVHIETQESYQIVELANHMNHVQIVQQYKANALAASNLDATPQGG
jgi:hypothetical protein